MFLLSKTIERREWVKWEEKRKKPFNEMTLYFRPKSWWPTSRSVTIIPNESLYASLFPNYLVRDSAPEQSIQKISQKPLHFNALLHSALYSFIHPFIRSDLFESTHIIVQFYCSKHTHRERQRACVSCFVLFDLVERLHWNYIKTNVKITCLTLISTFEHIHCQLIGSSFSHLCYSSRKI